MDDEPLKQAWAAVLLAGGAARRLGGADKAALTRDDGVRLLDAVAEAMEGAAQVVVVGSQRSTRRHVTWTREEPAGSGPLAAVSAGLAAVSPGIPFVVVCAVDQPGAGRAVPELLRQLGLPGRGAAPAGSAVLVDRDGRRQPLLSAHRVEALRVHLARIGDLRDRPARLLLDDAVIDCPDVWDAARDVDTPEQARSLGWHV